MLAETYDMMEAIDLMASRKDIFSDNHGNISCYVPGHKLVVIKPSGMSFSEIQEDDLVFYDVELDKVVQGRRKPSIDLEQHVFIYLNSKVCRTSICHSHSKYAVAYAITQKDINCACTEHADLFRYDIKCLDIPYDEYENWGRYVSYSSYEKAMLLPKHGAITLSDNPVDAVKLAIRLEEIAEKNYLAACLSQQTKVYSLDAGVAGRFHKRYNERYGQ
jgi:L-ribulose-5-phosphate 4-epimerase